MIWPVGPETCPWQGVCVCGHGRVSRLTGQMENTECHPLLLPTGLAAGLTGSGGILADPRALRLAYSPVRQPLRLQQCNLACGLLARHIVLRAEASKH